MSTDQSGFMPIPQPVPAPEPPVPGQPIPVPPVPAPPQPGVVPPMPQPGAVPPPYRQTYPPQPGAWPGQQSGQYAPMPAYSAPKQPSFFSDPKGVVSKLPLFAAIGLIGFCAYGLFMFIAQIIVGTSSVSSYVTGLTGSQIVAGLGYLLLGVASGVVWFAALMTLKYFADWKEPKPEE